MIYNITINKNTIKNQQQRKINNRRIRKKRKWDRLKEFRRFHSPAPQSLSSKKKEGGKMGKGEGRGDVMPFIDCPRSNKPN